MAIRKQTQAVPEGTPHITAVDPKAAIPGGEFQIHGKALARAERPKVLIGEVPAPIVVGSESFVVVKVPEGSSGGDLIVSHDNRSSIAWACDIGIQIADNLHPVANPAVDPMGNIYATFSGSRGQKTPVSVYKIDLNYTPKPFVSDVMNATAMCFDAAGMMYVTSRYDGIVYQVTPSGSVSVYVEGMGVATGLCFDPEENLYVGDRSGTIFKIARNRQIYVFATIEPSI
ncbi:MAG: IPT/TIG domain-containing protein, partial [Bryobacteraceae bacterium]